VRRLQRRLWYRMMLALEHNMVLIMLILTTAAGVVITVR